MFSDTCKIWLAAGGEDQSCGTSPGAASFKKGCRARKGVCSTGELELWLRAQMHAGPSLAKRGEKLLRFSSKAKQKSKDITVSMNASRATAEASV